jgi:transposase
MSNRLKMAEEQAILTLARLGWSYRRIAAEVGVDRETVARHVKAAAARLSASTPSGLPPGTASRSDAAISITGSVTADSHPSDGVGGEDKHPTFDAAGSNAAISITGSGLELEQSIPGRRSLCEPWRAVIVQGLQGGLSAQRIWQDLKDQHQFTDGYQSVQRFVQKLGQSLPLPVRRMEVEAGHEAQVDFGRGAPVVDVDGKRRTTWVFRIVLSHSRKAYAEAVFRQTTDDFLRSMENAFAHFSGVPRTLVIDNLRAAVKQADWFDPELCPKARAFAEHYGTAILPTRPYTPQHKGKVENGVKYVKSNALKGRVFTSLAEQNQHLSDWEAKVADLRIHGTTRQQVIGFFNRVEKPRLLPLPVSRFELFQESLRRVHRDGHVQLQGAYYSVPPEFLGQELWARWDGRTVRLFDRKMKPIALHAQKQPGAFSTIAAHIHPHKISGIEKGTDWLLGQVDRIGPQSRAWAQAVLKNRGIEGIRVLMGLISLGNQASRQGVERACEVAVSHGAYHLRTVRQLAKQQVPVPLQSTLAFASEHPIIRPVADYGQWLTEALSRQPADRA